MLAEMTLWGMYQYDKGLFDACPLPDGMSKQALIDCMMDKCGTLYPYHQSIPYFKRNISSWFRRNREQFSRIWEALRTEYAPLENYNRISKTHDEGETDGWTKNDGTTEGKVSAYNASSYSPDNQTIVDDEGSSHGNMTADHSEHTHGNVGVTTSQQMLAEEQAVREYDIYKRITTLFSHEFLIEVY